MKHPEDRYTLELAELPAVSGFAQKNEAPKRGRGRPRKDNALSDAERARRYRQRRALKQSMGERIKTMTHGEASKLRRAQPKGTLAFSVLCELTMAHLPFPAVTA